MKQLLINLKSVLENSNKLEIIKNIKISDTEETIKKVSVKQFPIIILSRGGESIATGAKDRIVKRMTVDILVAQRYDKIETVILGDHNVKGITELSDLILDAISENPKLNNYCRGFDPTTIRIEEGFLQNFSAYVAGRRLFIDFFKLKAIYSG